MRADRFGRVDRGLCLLVAALLIIDAVVHLRLAANYQLAQPSGIGEGTLFRLEAGVALLAAGYLVVRPSRSALVVAVIIGLSAFAAVVAYRYLDVPALGPLPRMYEPIWFFQKTLSAVAEGVAGLLALFTLARRRHTRPPARTSGSTRADTTPA